MPENKTVCAECGGKCCLACPGITVPKDWGAPNVSAMEERLGRAFATGRWCIDWWEGDPRPKHDELSRADFVRPVTQGHENELRHPGWGGPCTFHNTAVGCVLDYKDRPEACRELIPNECGKCDAVYTKRQACVRWLPYSGLLAKFS